ncbi:DNA-binding transcriptional ArsR family regulator [Aneurinibacillus soli]|uniref:Cadmium resistance transcriptional regulatory protein CadC n=1 Tax=Aneurinibacillus soli TaxID=1500254 RepID=A0A0U5BHH6_9BACL|nr:metalloregulator ArsR/SmtB family transcription factor [Aneurinibacillus soli]PYE61935.1 DNA-binding transcriptional ArsR family regulator [Aneurinibacillus soli]BAU29751.1 Cadmium resistance transcriptional regulatory protein CadC [Aneurinibacillus soli]
MKKTTSTEPSVCHLPAEEVHSLRKELAPRPIEHLAALFKGLADANRVKIGYILTRHEELCVHDIADLASISVANASHHLRLMRTLGLTKTRKEGTTVFYSLTDDHVHRILLLGMDHIEEGKHHEDYTE